MSHTTTIKSVTIKDVAALKAAVKELQAAGVDCTLEENQKPRMYYQNQHPQNSDYVLRLGNCPYDVGFDKQEDGSYAAVFDEWGGHIHKKIGAAVGECETTSPEHAIGRLMQLYSKNAAINAATAQGYMVEGCTTDKNGNLQLQIIGM